MGLIDKLFSSECKWCGNYIPPFSRQSEKVNGRIFCSLQCGLKYVDEMENICQKREIRRNTTPNNSKNINKNININKKYR